MHSKHAARLAKLEQAINPVQDTCRASQIVIYAPATGEPLEPLNPNAARYIWIPDNGLGLQRIAR